MYKIEKIGKIEALFACAGTDGERITAKVAIERLV